VRTARQEEVFTAAMYLSNKESRKLVASNVFLDVVQTANLIWYLLER
jgi:hypothetical protein